MASRAKRHTHKYYKVDVGFGRVFACALPECTHHMPQHLEKLLNGKKSICWSCGDAFLLNPLNLKLDKPICDECRLGIKEKEAV